MPRLALALCALWFVALFVFRSLVQWRKTGSTGFRGFRGPVGSLPWIGGASVSVGLALALLAPPAALLGWPAGAIVFASPPIHLTGAALVVLGTLGALFAQLSMGDSWRVGVDESETTELVIGGLFSRVRNPVFSFMGISLLGLLLMVPSGIAALACLLNAVGIEIQVRVVEEPYLKKTHGERYTRYAAAVGRFVPGVGRLARD